MSILTEKKTNSQELRDLQNRLESEIQPNITDVWMDWLLGDYDDLLSEGEGNYDYNGEPIDFEILGLAKAQAELETDIFMNTIMKEIKTFCTPENFTTKNLEIALDRRKSLYNASCKKIREYYMRKNNLKYVSTVEHWTAERILFVHKYKNEKGEVLDFNDEENKIYSKADAVKYEICNEQDRSFRLYSHYLATKAIQKESWEEYFKNEFTHSFELLQKELKKELFKIFKAKAEAEKAEAEAEI